MVKAFTGLLTSHRPVFDNKAWSPVASKKLPSIQWYPGDWMRDPAVRAVSLAARGFWFDMLCLMFDSPRRGYLQHKTGQPVTAAQLARMTGCATDEVPPLLQELEDAGVFSRTDDGVIFSRRMARDERKRQLCSEAGKRGGGNPTLKGGAKGGGKGAAKRNPNPSSSSSISSSTSESPIGDSKTPLPPEGDEAAGSGDAETAEELEFVQAWNGCDGVVRNKGPTLSDGRRKHFIARLKDPGWDWRGALAKFPLRLTVGHPDGWKPDMDFFLKPDSVLRILEGKYDWSKSSGKPQPTRVGPGQLFDPGARERDPRHGDF